MRRFGRNQKRKLKMQLQHALEVAQLHKDRAFLIEYANRKNIEIINETAEILGRHFISQPPGDVMVTDLKELLRGYWEVEQRECMYRVDFNGQLVDSRIFLREALPILRLHSKTVDLGLMQHHEFRYNGRMVGYAISEKFITLMKKEAAIKKMADAMARMLYDEIVKNDKGKHYGN